MFHPNLGLGRGSKPRAAIRGGVALTLALLLQVALASPQERETTTPDMPDIASDAAPAPAGAHARRRGRGRRLRRAHA